MIRKPKYLFYCLSVLLTAFLAQRCANAVAPTGGPKDNTPPRVVEAVPENNSINFIGKKIEITFDEYVTLENANQNVLISPPLSQKPDIKLKNKTVVVKFKEDLALNTTYTINFGSAIKDLHEGNLFKDYVYSFSTGDRIDTLSITGKVVDATEKKPVENVYVSLYASDRDNLDSLPMSTIPNYITKTDKQGNFSLNGIADKRYLLFALKDVNSNLYFDLPNEEIAFFDTLVPANSNNLTLYMFGETDSTQVLLEKKLIEEGLLRFVFRHPAKDAIIMTPEMLPDSFNLVTMHSSDYDTVWWYFTPHVKDSLWVQVKYNTIINDSSHYSLKFKEQENKKRGRQPEKLKVSNNLVGRGGLIPGQDLILKFSEPIVLYQMRDSAVFKRDTTVYYNQLAFEQADDEGLQYRSTTPFSVDSNYSFTIPDSVFFSIRGRTNNSIQVDFHILNDDEYGNIYITVVPPKGMKQVVVQLTNESGKVLKQEIITKKQEVMFDYLMPAKYKIQAILDADGNGKWSTGNYHHLLQPETILEYQDPLEIKAGWDIDLEEAWEL
ncbi:MAG: Ig-like domain-containing protein [Bacteroidales bacterium]|nr:Ig-like domain-containing protein [Bacteroidales bacterium]MBQ6306660.1 Ig-like domain-containing protein [Bacteroidales bacterium]